MPDAGEVREDRHRICNIFPGERYISTVDVGQLMATQIATWHKMAECLRTAGMIVETE
jgi:hypothetical protein